MATMPKNLRMTGDRLSVLRDKIKELASKEVLVGFPEGPPRGDDTPLTNAALAYIHDNGAPEQNIPARPFMVPGIAAVQDQIADTLTAGARRLVVVGDRALSIDKELTRVGLMAVTSIRRTVTAGVPPPLADVTLRDRLRRHKGRAGEKLELESRAMGNAPSTDFAKPLIDTGQLYRAVDYVIRERKDRT